MLLMTFADIESHDIELTFADIGCCSRLIMEWQLAENESLILTLCPSVIEMAQAWLLGSVLMSRDTTANLSDFHGITIGCYWKLLFSEHILGCSSYLSISANSYRFHMNLNNSWNNFVKIIYFIERPKGLLRWSEYATSATWLRKQNFTRTRTKKCFLV